MAGLAMPSNVDAINLEWLAAILRKRFPDSRFRKAEVVDVISGTSTKVRVSLAADTPAGAETPPSTIIVKGGFEPHCSALAPLYRTEALFYRDVQPVVALRAPEAYFVHVDEDAHHSIVVMEDLRARGVDFCHAQKPQDYATVERRLDALARLHAATWNSRLFETGGPWERIETRFRAWSEIYAQRYFAPEVWKRYIRSPRGAAVSTRLHDGVWLEAALKKLGCHHRAMPICLINGDTHLGNLYIDIDGEPGFFDPQVARAPWHLEISYYLCAALDVVDRRLWERDLLTSYLRALAAAGGPVVPFDDAWTQYRLDLIYGFYIFIINETRFQTEAINTAYTGRFAAAILDHGVIAMLDAL